MTKGRKTLTFVLIPQRVLPFEAVTPSMMTCRSALSLQFPQFRTNEPKPSAVKPLMESVPAPLNWKTLSVAPFELPPVIVVVSPAACFFIVKASSPELCQS